MASRVSSLKSESHPGRTVQTLVMHSSSPFRGKANCWKGTSRPSVISPPVSLQLQQLYLPSDLISSLLTPARYSDLPALCWMFQQNLTRRIFIAPVASAKCSSSVIHKMNPPSLPWLCSYSIFSSEAATFPDLLHYQSLFPVGLFPFPVVTPPSNILSNWLLLHTLYLSSISF